MTEDLILKTSILFIVIITFGGCASTHFSNYWPYSQLPPNKVRTLAPKTYNDCLPAIDSVLSPVVKKHFRNQDSTIAVIELCQEIGGFFTTNWLLYRYNEYYHWPLNEYEKLPKKPIDIASLFISYGIYHPEAMIRVMFTCYYKYLNGQVYNWNEEINKMKTVWPAESATNYNPKLPKVIALAENSKISKHQFSLLTELDTANILFNRSPRMTKESSDWYYVTGLINFKIQETESINIRILNIESEFNEKYILRDNDTLRIGDTITDNHSGWLSRNRYYFNYNKCTETREAFNVR